MNFGKLLKKYMTDKSAADSELLSSANSLIASHKEKKLIDASEQLAKTTEKSAKQLAKTTRESAQLLAKTTQSSAEQLAKTAERSEKRMTWLTIAVIATGITHTAILVVSLFFRPH